MSKLDETLYELWRNGRDQEDRYVAKDAAKQEVKNLMLELINSLDGMYDSQGASDAFDGITEELRQKVNDL